MKPFISILLAIFLVIPVAKSVAATDCVVLIHGLARSSTSMSKMAQALTSDGYIVVIPDYPSRAHGIAQLSVLAIDTSLAQCADADKIHFVTHSLGGVLLRHYVQHHNIEKLGRVVMLGPPNKGSEVVDFYARWPGVANFGGPAFLELASHPDKNVPLQLGAVNFELGVIAGNRSINPILSSIIPGKDDGKVSVESTKVEGMSAHLTMPVSHPFMMRKANVIKATRQFLLTGNF